MGPSATVTNRPFARRRGDCQVGINTPVTRNGPTAVRGPHYDRLTELFAGLLYFRHPDDRSSGGDLQVNGPQCDDDEPDWTLVHRVAHLGVNLPINPP